MGGKWWETKDEGASAPRQTRVAVDRKDSWTSDGYRDTSLAESYCRSNDDFRHRRRELREHDYGNTGRRCFAKPRLWEPFMPSADSSQLKNLFRRNWPSKIFRFVLQYFGHLYTPSQKKRLTSMRRFSIYCCASLLPLWDVYHIHLSSHAWISRSSATLTIESLRSGLWLSCGVQI